MKGGGPCNGARTTDKQQSCRRKSSAYETASVSPCPNLCKSPNVHSGGVHDGGVMLEDGVCFAFSGPPREGKRYCGPKISIGKSGKGQYSSEGGVDCRKCKPCPDLCKFPYVKSGRKVNGGLDLKNGVCPGFSGPATQGYKKRFCGPEIANGNKEDFYTKGGIDCRNCKIPAVQPVTKVGGFEKVGTGVYCAPTEQYRNGTATFKQCLRTIGILSLLRYAHHGRGRG